MNSKNNSNHFSSLSPKCKASFMLRPISTQVSKLPHFLVRSYSPNTSLSPRSLKIASVFDLTKVTKEKFKGKRNQSSQKMKQIKRTIQIQDQVKVQFQSRQLKNQFFIKYEYKPFTKQIYQLKADKTKIPSPITDKQKKPVPIIQALKKNDLKRKLNEKVTKIDMNLTRIPKILIDDLQSKKKIKQISFKNTNKIQNIQKVLRSINMFQQEERDLNRITTIQEQNFFKKKRENQPFSLFQVLKNSKNVMFMNGTQQLHTLNFCFLMSMRSQSRMSEIINRDLSTFSRSLCINTITLNMPVDFRIKQKQIELKVNQLTTDDLFLITIGQIDQQMALNAMSIAQEQNENIIRKNDAQQKPKEVLYKQNHRHFQQNQSYQNKLDKTQLSYWKTLQYSVIEKKQQDISKNYLIEMKEILRKQIKLLKFGLKSPAVHDRFQKEKELALCKHLQENVDQIVDLKKRENEKKVRLSKILKNKTENIKLRQISSALQKTWKQMQTIKENLNKRVKSKTKSKSVSKSKNKRGK